jgi:hypothetical protein
LNKHVLADWSPALDATARALMLHAARTTAEAGVDAGGQLPSARAPQRLKGAGAAHDPIDAKPTQAPDVLRAERRSDRATFQQFDVEEPDDRGRRPERVQPAPVVIFQRADPRGERALKTLRLLCARGSERA